MANAFYIAAFGRSAIQAKAYRRAQSQPDPILNNKPAAIYEAPESVEPLDITGAPVDRYSYLGTPIWAPLTIEQGGQSVEFTSALIHVVESSTMVRTPVQGRDGTVKEWFSYGDHEITLELTISSIDSEVYPYDQVQAARDILRKKTSIDVVSDYLLLYEVYQLAIEKVEWIQRPGFKNIQGIRVTAYSDSPEELLDYVGND